MSSLLPRQAVLLAGGKGTRLMPLTATIPKPLVNVKGKPFLFWQLEYLRRQGIQQVVLLLGHLGDVVVEYFTRNPIVGLNIVYSTEPTPLGTGGALRLAFPKLESTFFLLNGDSFLNVDLRAVAKQFAARRWVASVVYGDPQTVGVLGNLHVNADKVLEYRREAGFEFVDAGVYLISKSIVADGPTGTFDLGTYWVQYAARGQVGGFPCRERFFDIGTPERLKIFSDHIDDYF